MAPLVPWPGLAQVLRLHFHGAHDGVIQLGGARGQYTGEVRGLIAADRIRWLGSVVHPRLPKDAVLLDLEGAAEDELPAATARTGDVRLDARLRIAGAPGKLMAALDEDTRATLAAVLDGASLRVSQGRVGFELNAERVDDWPDALPPLFEAAHTLARRLVQVLVPMDLVEVVRCHPDPEIKLAYLETLLAIAPEVLDRLPPEIHGLELSLLVRRVRAAQDRRGQLSTTEHEGGGLGLSPGGTVSLWPGPKKPDGG